MCQPILTISVVHGPVDTPSDRFPVNTHIFRDSASRQVCCKPPHSKVEVLRKAATGTSPWDICYKHAMFGTFNAVRVIRYFNESTTPVQPTPDTWMRVLLVVRRHLLWQNGQSSSCHTLGLAWMRIWLTSSSSV